MGDAPASFPTFKGPVFTMSLLQSSGPTLPAQTVAVIPARLGARRLPGKPLALIGGQPLIWRVYERVLSSGVFDAVWVAADDARIADAVRLRGGLATVIDHPCQSGTERVARAAAHLDAKWIVNVQGDEPFIEHSALRTVVELLKSGAEIATLRAPLSPEDRGHPSTVKVVGNQGGRALYFSRAPIPGDQHIGIYGFTASALQAVATLPRGPLATAEDLEQLTWLEAGWSIRLGHTPHATLSIDTPQDLLAAQRRFSEAHP